MSDLVGNYDSLSLIVVVGAVACAVMLLLMLSAGFSGERRQLARRLKRVQIVGGRAQTANVTMRLDSSDSSIAGLDRFIKRVLPRPAKLRERLARTGRRISLGEYVLASALVALLDYIVVGVLLGQKPIIGIVSALTTGLWLPHAFVGFLGSRRLKLFTSQFPEAIELIVRGLRSGLPVTESIKSVGTEMEDPVGGEFRRIADSLRLGQTLDQALWAGATRLDTPEFRFFVISLSVQQETGGNLAETLENLANILRKRKQMKKKIKALSAEARASAMIIGSLPFVMFGALFLVNPEYALILVRDPRGLLLLAAAATSLLLGIGIMFKMARFEI